MDHDFVFDHETESDAVFVCARCGALIGFNKASTSDPHATPLDVGWAHPQNPEQWISPCIT